MDRVNKFHIISKVGNTKFVLKSSQIAEHLSISEDGDETYFDNIRAEQFFALVSKEDLEGVVYQQGASFKNPMHANSLTPIAYVVWQIMLSNILPQTGHTTELSYFAVYTLFGILTGKKINIPLLILNHLFRCRNQRRASLPYARMITALVLKSSVKIKASELYKAMVKEININTFLCRNVLRRDGNVYTYVDSKKRKVGDEAPPPDSPPHATPTQPIPRGSNEDDLSYLDDIHLPSPSEEQARQPPTGVGNVTLDMLSQQLSLMQWNMQSMSSRQERLMRSQDRLMRNQEMMVRDLASQYNFDMSKYDFGTPHSSPPQE